MKRLLLLLLFCSQLWATTYYISPGGSDANSGTSSGSPFKTFSHAIPLLNAGDTLYLLSGTYQPGTGIGFPNINCTSGAHNGSSGSPVTMQALNERQAWVKGDGSAAPFTMHNCTYWNIVGIHFSDADSASSSENDAAVQIYTSTHMVFRRNIIDHANRCKNVQLVFFGFNSTNNLIEENEFYFHHRWGISFWQGSNNNEVRRNYDNPRGYFAASNPSCTTYGGGATGWGPYYSNSNTFENNIGETHSSGDDDAEDNEATSSSNLWLGDVMLNRGSHIGAHSDPTQPSGNTFTNDVVINSSRPGFWERGGVSTVLNHDSIFGGSSSEGFGLDPSTTAAGYTGGFGMQVNNSQVQNVTSGIAYFVATGFTGFGPYVFSYTHDNCFNDSTCYNPNANVTSPLAVNPAFGSCYLWVPATSPLHAAASDGGDVGATVLYQYVGGVLTTNKLWDSSTGAPLFAGAIVTGLNNVAGSSLFDIANRLNINKNGCAFPSAYAGSSSPPNPPTGLTAVVH